MQQHMDPNPPSSFDRLRTASDWLNFFIRAWAFVLEVFLRTGFGPRYFGLQAVAAILLILLFPALWPGHNPVPMLGLLWLYLGMCLLARIDMMARALRRKSAHSRYDGRPRLGRLLPRMDEVAIKAKVEPALGLAVGIGIVFLNAPLGVFLIGGSVCLAASIAAGQAYEQARAQDAFDSILEARLHAERVRAMAGDSF
ncbi:MAG: hypothetical protein KF745_02865 [Phycisphaeraceae bacterium]|nr:hypothetical protein [Phycisphaeraceae bacterium]